MSDAIKVGFVPLASAARGILVVFCDEALKVGPATAKALGGANELVKRAAAAASFRGKSGAPRRFRPGRREGRAADRDRRGEDLEPEGQRFPQIRRHGGQQA